VRGAAEEDRSRYTRGEGAKLPARTSARTNNIRRFSHVHVENWRNFRRVDASLADRVFLVGPNAAGKSNLLDVFRFLRDLAVPSGGLASAVLRRGGISRMRALTARRYSDVVVTVQLESANDTRWEYSLRISQDNQQRPIVKHESVLRNDEIVVDRDTADETDQEERTQTLLEQVKANRGFREVADFFSSVRYLHLVPQLVREPERSVGRRNDPYGGDFIEQIARTPLQTQRARLRRITEALRVAVPQLERLELTVDVRGIPHLRGKYENWRASGAWQEEGDFSDGTLRLMGLLWALQDGNGPLMLEEPELSLHTEVVRYIPQMLWHVTQHKGRQVMVSTHSNELLFDSGIGVDEVFLLVPGLHGTSVRRADSYAEIVDLLEGGASLAEAVLPHTRPTNAHQLNLFDW